jgi:hypothetical protein
MTSYRVLRPVGSALLIVLLAAAAVVLGCSSAPLPTGLAGTPGAALEPLDASATVAVGTDTSTQTTPTSGGGLTTAGSATGAPTGSARLSLIPMPTSACTTYSSHSDPVADLAKLLPLAVVVFVGEITDIGSTHWTTPVGVHPKTGVFLPVIPATTPITIAVGELIRGSRLPSSVVVEFPGGAMGCDRIEVDGFPLTAELRPGDRYVFFFDPWPGTGEPPFTDLELAAAWRVRRDDAVVFTRYDGDVQLGQLKRRLAAISVSPGP